MCWLVEDHLSRCCGGRVLSSLGDPKLFMCSICGSKVAGDSPEVICACGSTVGTTKRDAGLRCMANPCPTPYRPAQVEVVALSRYETHRK